ncbi:MAG: tetratricopeptide repeat protein [Myxococcota bacterium]
MVFSSNAGDVPPGTESAPRGRLQRDGWGAPVSPTNAGTLEAWERTVLALCGHRADTGAHLAEVLRQDPSFLPGLCLKGFALLFKGRNDLRDDARAVHALAERVVRERGATPREVQLVAALGEWIADDMVGASDRFGALLEEAPTDLFVVKLEHGCLFMQGRPKALRARIERVLPAWSADLMGYGYVLGCHAFALEETHALEEAERVGRRAVAHQPDDAWGIHGVSHVMEMQDRSRDGVAWLKEHAPGYAACNNFRAHVYWHRALFHCELGEHDAAVALYDDEVHNEWTGDYRDMSNRASLLWRLEADGLDVGDRWEDLGARARERFRDHGSAFADAHYVLALGRVGACAELVASLRDFAASGQAGDQAEVTRAVALPLCEAMSATLQGADAVDGLARLQNAIVRLGGSNAQRDLFELFFIDAALRAGRNDVAKAALSRRLLGRPNNRWARTRLATLA